MLSRLLVTTLLFCLILSDDLVMEDFGEAAGQVGEEKTRKEPSQSEVQDMRTMAISCTLMTKHYLKEYEADVMDATQAV